MTRKEETQRLLTGDNESMELRPRSAQGQNNVEAGNTEEDQGDQQSQEVRIRF